MSRKTKIRIITVITVVALLVVAYATFAQPLATNTVTKTLSWDIGFTNVIKTGVYGEAQEISQPSFSHTDASFNVALTGPNDKITYEFTIENMGTVDARLESINIIPNNFASDAVLYTVSGLNIGDELKAGDSTKMLVTVSYNNSVQDVSNNYQKSARIIANYVEK